MKVFGGQVQCFIMGGAALNPEAEQCFKKMKLPYTVGYGMTEACPLLGWEWWTEFVPGSCGKPVHELRINSDDPAHQPARYKPVDAISPQAITRIPRPLRQRLPATDGSAPATWA